jgi:hypothetical protein
VLTTPILAGEHEAAAAALQQIDEYRQTGAPPAAIQALIDNKTAKDSDNALIAFLARLSFTTYRAALTADQARLLSAATLFSEGVPIPLAALAAAGAAHGAESAEQGLTRLLGLGLLDDWGQMRGHLRVGSGTSDPTVSPTAPRPNVPVAGATCDRPEPCGSGVALPTRTFLRRRRGQTFRSQVPPATGQSLAGREWHFRPERFSDGAGAKRSGRRCHLRPASRPDPAGREWHFRPERFSDGAGAKRSGRRCHLRPASRPDPAGREWHSRPERCVPGMALILEVEVLFGP